MLPVTSLTEGPAAIGVDLGAIFVSMELCRQKWLMTSLAPGGGEKMSKHTFTARPPTPIRKGMGEGYTLLAVQPRGLFPTDG